MKRTLCVIISLIMLFSSAIAYAATDTETAEACKELLAFVLDSFGEDDEYFYYDIDYNESGFTIYMAESDAFVIAAAVKLGLYDYELWESYATSMAEWVSSLQAVIEACELENSNLLFVLLDEWSHDEVVLIIYNGTVLYSYTPLQ